VKGALSRVELVAGESGVRTRVVQLRLTPRAPRLRETFIPQSGFAPKFSRDRTASRFGKRSSAVCDPELEVVLLSAPMASPTALCLP